MTSLSHPPLCAQYVFFVTHWSACAFYFIARLHHLGQDTWLGRHFDDALRLPLADRWAAAACLATLGDGHRGVMTRVAGQ